jgi:hypothetical protein
MDNVASSDCSSADDLLDEIDDATPVRALLVFLNLLKCNPERVADFRLSHLEPAHAHAAADVLVDKVRRFGLWHGVLRRILMVAYDITAQLVIARNRSEPGGNTS